jgi:DNA helicase-2/ATP-dependent DNA helicase PcrA
MTNLDAESETLARRNSDQDAVRLSTVHQAKGLEWRAVIVLWATEGMFPLARSLVDEPDAEEERRLFYVAVTRAKDDLCLCVPHMRMMRDGGAYPCEPSRFIREIDPGLLKEIGTAYY